MVHGPLVNTVILSVPGIKKLPLHRPVACARAGTNSCGATLLAVLCTAALREANTSLPCNGGCRQRILRLLPFPRALCEPLFCSALRPVPSIGGSLWVRLQFYFRFIGLAN